MIRAVIDTNVLVSDLLAPAGNEALVLLAIHRGLVQPCVSPAIPAEYAAVLARPKFRLDPADIEAALTMFRSQGTMLTPAESEAALPDPDDTNFIACADAASANDIVTGNKRHFPAASYGTARAVSGAAFLDCIVAEI